MDDVQAAVASYRDALGLPVTFQDGDRWATLDTDGFTVALAGPVEQPAGDAVTLGIKVSDVDAALESVVAAGGTVVAEPQDGGHERHAACWGSRGKPLVLYSPLRRP